MKFYSAITKEALESDFSGEYKDAHAIGVVRTGSSNLFFRAGLRHYVIPFSEITGLFRRINVVPAQLCCGKGDLEMESLVVVADGREVAVIQLPGKKAARALIAELKEKLPEVDFSVPAKTEET